MIRRWWRLGLRPQLTLIVILGTLLTTVATLFIADNAITTNLVSQAETQEQANMKIAQMLLATRYGQYVSIASNGDMVADSPTAGQNFVPTQDNSYGRYPLNNTPDHPNTDFVDGVKQLVQGTASVYQCANQLGNAINPCTLIETTIPGPNSSSVSNTRLTGDLSTNVFNAMNLQHPDSAQEWVGVDTVNDVEYIADQFSRLFYSGIRAPVRRRTRRPGPGP